MTQEILLVYGILFLAVVLFSTDWLRADLAALFIMVLLAWTGILPVETAFSGFASSAVVSIMGVMLLGYGIERTGVMSRLSLQIHRLAGKSEKRILTLIFLSVGLISAFMQNIGAAALFLPVVRKLSLESEKPISLYLMPMGFAAILGGTLTMVGSGPLILLNDLLIQSGLEPYPLFSVTPLGLSLLFCGLLFFLIFGHRILPSASTLSVQNHQQFLKDLYRLPQGIQEVKILAGSPLSGRTLDESDLWNKYRLHLLALRDGDSTVYAPWRKTRFAEGQVLAVSGSEAMVTAFALEQQLFLDKTMGVFAHLKQEEQAGFAELLIPPRSSLNGKFLWDISFRRRYHVEPILCVDPTGRTLSPFEHPLASGQQLVVFGLWEDLAKLRDSRELVVVTPTPSSREKVVRGKGSFAMSALLLSLILIFMGTPLPLAFFTGALIMILTGVLPKEEIYSAIDWKTVFLLAGLIPLGLAFDQSGAATWTADLLMNSISSWGSLPVLGIIALLTTLFSLFMSNVAATVLLVPLVVLMAQRFQMDPRGLALLVAVCASNSFALPTHQVNAFLMTPGGYKNKDYLKAGGGMTLLFLVVAVLFTYLFYI